MKHLFEHKDSGIDWLGKIPGHWDFKRLKYIANIQFSNVDKKSYEYEDKVLLCNYVDVFKNEMNILITASNSWRPQLVNQN